MASREEAYGGARGFYDNDVLAARVWTDKYAAHDKEGDFKETSPMDTHDRLLTYFPGDDGVEQSVRNGWFIPAGRIQFTMGNRYVKKSTQLNCYVIPIKDDSIEAIFECAKEMARTYSYGGGCGIDIGCLRFSGAAVNNTAITSSGSASFMDMFSNVTGTIGQHGRRGALMITIPVHHPDARLFMRMKDDLDPKLLAKASPELKNYLYEHRTAGHANVSLKLSDEFMKAVEDGKQFRLHWESKDGEISHEEWVDARDYWSEICHQAWKQAEPGLLFWDRMVEESPSNQYEGGEILTTNPCGEQPLPPYDSCNLGSVNLRHMVHDAWTDAAEVDWDRFELAIRAGVRFLDKVRTIEKEEGRFPLKEQEAASELFRRIGVGIMGFGEMMASLGLVYGSDESLVFAEKLFEFMRNKAYDESVELAKELGPFPAFDWERHRRCPFVRRLPEALQSKIAEHGLRNVTVLSFAPTGTIAILGQTSGGVEPMFAPIYKRYSNLGGKRRMEFNVYDHAILRWQKAVNANFPTDAADVTPETLSLLPPFFVFSHDIPWKARVDLQGMAQKYVDSSISSTINLPADTSEDEVATIYMRAWRAGCKGVTVYRENCRENILEIATKVDEEEKIRQPKWVRPMSLRANSLSYKTHNQRVIINFCDDENDDLREVQVIMGRSGDDMNAMCEALGRCISKLLQNGVPVGEISDSLRGIKAGETQWSRFDDSQEAPYVVRSVPDFIAAYIQHRYVRPEVEKAATKVSSGTNGASRSGHKGNGQAVPVVSEIRRGGDCPACEGLDEFGR